MKVFWPAVALVAAIVSCVHWIDGDGTGWLVATGYGFTWFMHECAILDGGPR